MFESNLLSQINIASPLPTAIEVQLTTSINASLYKAFQFGHTLLAEKSDWALSLLPWNDEIYMGVSAVLERLLLEHADTTFTEMIFALRRAELDGPLAAAPSLASSSGNGNGVAPGARGRYLRWLLLGPPPVPTPEERAMNFVNNGASSQLRVSAEAALPPSPLPPSSTAPILPDATTPAQLIDAVMTDAKAGFAGDADAAALAQLNSAELLKAEHAPYGYLRFKPLSRSNKIASLFLLTVMPYMERKAEQWYARNTDSSVDAIAMRDAYAYRYPHRAALLRFLARYVYPVYHVMKHGSRFAYLVFYLLEMTPFTSPLHRIFGIALRRSTNEDALNTSPRARRALLIARVVLILIFCSFRLLDFTRNAETAGTVGAMGDTALPIPPPPLLGADVPLPEDRSGLPKAGECPVCHKRVTNAAVCLVSGIVGCYPCLQGYVREHQACPVTQQSMSVEQIRRIFEC
ncbi:peroxin 12 putative (PEX12) [Leptomonas pyrrhocoris]|uniref:Peroxin-12 n=1 Tax=Leptomonas pyrrhocoris TaxID=157538 RepID=A0A0N0VGE7_LEPPY|nr:peroxin 12 putative (PEX12) [Leptomonas pyrrhocoris]KPA82898.1 peroxin 12 putative (PEX12) [Leptomonas pyrrhocoris]|eukprot:XP_015661337.1 peroxin 12 putative (PEX12) [Leptomonas pyrrhocoris]